MIKKKKQPVVHGHLSITLKNAETGNVEFYEEADNTVTPAIANILTNNLAGTVNMQNLTPFYQKILGGVCIWNDEISDTTEVFLPDEAIYSLTAHAGQNSYDADHGGAADDLTRGIPNTALSEEILSNGKAIGWKHVWTWDTTQGNGPIRSLTLTHTDTGDCGTGKTNLTFPTYSPLGFINNNTVAKRYYNFGDYVKKQPFEMYDKNNLVTYSVTGMTCTVNIVPIILTKTDLLGAAGEGQVDHSVDFDVTLAAGTADNINNCRHFFFVKGKKLIIGILTSQPTNTIYLNTIDLDLQTNTTSTLSLSQQISLNINNGYRPMHIGFNPMTDNGTADYIYVFNSSVSGYCKIDISTGTVSDLTGSSFSDINRNSCWGIYLGNNRLVLAGGVVINNNNAYQGLVENPAVAGSGSRGRNFFGTGSRLFKPLLWSCGVSESYAWDCTYPSALLNKFYAATVYNLNSTVTKTQAQTMQVEYSITLDQGES